MSSIVYSHSVKDECFKIKIGCLEGKRPVPNLSQLIDNPHLLYSGLEDNARADLLIECTLDSDSRPLCPPMQTTYKYSAQHRSWNEWIEFPIAICDLPRDTIVVIKIFDAINPSKTVMLGKALVTAFGHQGVMRTGLHDLRVWLEEDFEKSNPTLSGQDELDRLYELKSNYHNGQLPKINWLDKLTFIEMEKMTQKVKSNSKNMFLSVEFPKALIENTQDVPIVYYEMTYDDQKYVQLPRHELNVINDPEIALENIIEIKHHKLSRSARSCLSDKDLKPNAMVRDQLNAIVSYPPTKILTSEEQDLIWKFRYYLMSQKKALTKFLKCVNWQAPAEVKIALELLDQWQPMDTQDALELLTPQFQHPQVRYYAVSRLLQASDEDLLLYLLQLVQALKYENYTGAAQEDLDTAQPAQIVTQQVKNIQIADQLSGLVLSPKDLQGRLDKQKDLTSHMVGVSSKTDEAKQLEHDVFGEVRVEQTQPVWDLATFLIKRCVQDDVLANYFYWYLVVEIENFSQNLGDLSTASNTTSIASNQKNMQAHLIYTNIMDRFIRSLSNDQDEYRRRRDFLARQRMFVDKLVLLMKMIARENKNRLGKIEKLKESLADPEILKFDFTHLDPPLSLPLDPNIKIQGVVPDKATLFKSQLMPCRLTLRTTILESAKRFTGETASLSSSPIMATFSNQMSPSGSPHHHQHAMPQQQIQQQTQQPQQQQHQHQQLQQQIHQQDHEYHIDEGNSMDDMRASPFLEYYVIFKHGDDLRQDQLILQTITLMDKLLRRENLDLKLTPYRVLATSTRHGFVQYVDSKSLAEVRAIDGSIQNFFRRYAAAPDAPYGIIPEVMDTYVRSCAGYCVITYLLGVGDRHLDNLLLTKTGKLFHIDFGYILGRDPKPMPPPPMKLTREMVEAMGGTSSDLYRDFLNLSHTAFLHLRRHSNLILNLFSLMVEANVPDIALEPDKTVKKVQDKFRLDLTDEEAVHYMQNLIEISVTDVMAVLVEQIHKIAQYWRK